MQPLDALKTEGLSLPWAFADPDSAVELLRTYYRERLERGESQRDGADPWFSPGKHAGYVGAYFDRWEGEVDPQPNVFTPADILAVQTLSVYVRGWVALDLVDRRREHFSALLAEVPTDVDLWEADGRTVDAAMELERELRRYDQVGATTASKLIARKRPGLYPIYDSVVLSALGLKKTLFHELHAEFVAHPELIELCGRLQEAAGLPASISVLRIFDVVTWMGQRSSFDAKQRTAHTGSRQVLL